MNKLQDVFENLRKKSYETRVRFLWGSVAIVALVLVAVWVFSLKSTLGGLDNSNPPAAANSIGSVATDQQYVQIERVESNDQGFKVYFNVSNPTTNIMSFSQFQNIQLSAGGTSYTAKQLTDRQGATFVQKILSNSENFGIAIFGPIDGDSGKITFDNMSFDNTTQPVFKQELNLDFKKLENTVDLRQ